MMRTVVVALVLIIAILLGVVAQGAKAPRTPVDLNQASVRELTTLPGVGESKAQAIIRYRAIHPFVRASDLLHVKGIGRGLFARLRPFLTLGPAVTTAPAPASVAPRPGVWPGAAGQGSPPFAQPTSSHIPRAAP